MYLELLDSSIKTESSVFLDGCTNFRWTVPEVILCGTFQINASKVLNSYYNIMGFALTCLYELYQSSAELLSFLNYISICFQSPIMQPFFFHSWAQLFCEAIAFLTREMSFLCVLTGIKMIFLIVVQSHKPRGALAVLFPQLNFGTRVFPVHM